MATENRTPDDLQEAVAATLRRLRGEVGKTGPAPAAERVEPQLSSPIAEPILPAATREPAAMDEPDLLSRAQPEIPPTPAARHAMREGPITFGEPARSRLRWVPYTLSLAAIVVFAGIVWWAYQAIVAGPKIGPVPVIDADTTPAKIPPADQGASDTSGQQKTVYDQISGATSQPKPEVLLPAPDVPQTPPPPPAPSPSATDATGTTTDTTGTAAATAGSTGTTSTADTSGTASTTQTLIPPAAPLAPAPPLAPATSTSTDTSGAASTATGGTSTAGGSSTEATQPSTTTADAGSSATLPAAGSDAGSVDTGASTDAGIDLYGVPTLAPTSAAPAATAVTTADTTGTAGATEGTSTVEDKFRIQLAALKSQAEADKAWKRILAKHNDVLGSLTVHIVKADLGSQGIYYRVQAGPFADKASAKAACDQLKSAGQQCLVKP